MLTVQPRSDILMLTVLLDVIFVVFNKDKSCYLQKLSAKSNQIVKILHEMRE